MPDVGGAVVGTGVAATVGAGVTLPPPVAKAGAPVVGAIVIGATVTGANVTGANVTGADVTGAAVMGMLVTGAAVPGMLVTGAAVTGADGIGMLVTGAAVTGANEGGFVKPRRPALPATNICFLTKPKAPFMTKRVVKRMFVDGSNLGANSNCELDSAKGDGKNALVFFSSFLPLPQCSGSSLKAIPSVGQPSCEDMFRHSPLIDVGVVYVVSDASSSLDRVPARQASYSAS